MSIKKIALFAGAFAALSMLLASMSKMADAGDTHHGSLVIGNPQTGDKDPGKHLITVKNVSGTTLVNGDVVIWTHLDASTGTAISTSSVLADGQVAGVIVDTIANNSFGRLQTYGFHSAIKVRASDISTGTLLGVGTTERFAQTVTSTQTSLGFSFQFVGTTVTQTVKGFIKTMGR